MKKTILIIIILCACFPAHAEIPEALAVHCILGEVQGEGERGIRANAQALKNRGTTSGVYGCKADISKDMAYIRHKGLDKIALEEWRRGANDIVHGAQFWGSIILDQEWIERMKRAGYKFTVRINNHEYYKKP